MRIKLNNKSNYLDEPFHLWVFSGYSCIVILPTQVAEKMEEIAKQALPNEIGGTLVGSFSEDFKMAYIKKVLGVKGKVKNSPTSFYRPPDCEDNQLSILYNESKGSIHYLGEWHSHPNNPPLPSHRDLKSLF
jgi:integrative and conjugative element protein (TIGR02256 family)